VAQRLISALTLLLLVVEVVPEVVPEAAPEVVVILEALDLEVARVAVGLELVEE
jgi:hypothetical protein